MQGATEDEMRARIAELERAVRQRKDSQKPVACRCCATVLGHYQLGDADPHMGAWLLKLRRSKGLVARPAGGAVERWYAGDRAQLFLRETTVADPDAPAALIPLPGAVLCPKCDHRQEVAAPPPVREMRELSTLLATLESIRHKAMHESCISAEGSV